MPRALAMTKEIVRILSGIIASVEGLENKKTLFSDCSLSLQEDLIFARMCGRYKGLLHKVICDLKTGVPLENIKIFKGGS